MASVSEDTEVKASADGAQTFIDSYYQAAGERRSLRPYYVNSSAKYDAASVKADISINGLVCKEPEELERLLETQANGSRVKYEVEGFDAQVLNPDFQIGCPDHLKITNTTGRASARDRADRDNRISILAVVNGSIQFGTDKEAPKRPFTETFVLVPNWDSMGPKAPRNAKRFLVLSQNYRTL